MTAGSGTSFSPDPQELRIPDAGVRATLFCASPHPFTLPLPGHLPHFYHLHFTRIFSLALPSSTSLNLALNIFESVTGMVPHEPEELRPLDNDVNINAVTPAPPRVLVHFPNSCPHLDLTHARIWSYLLAQQQNAVYLRLGVGPRDIVSDRLYLGRDSTETAQACLHSCTPLTQVTHRVCHNDNDDDMEPIDNTEEWSWEEVAKDHGDGDLDRDNVDNNSEFLT
ncbi:hypothetical protein EDB86DRAFT_2826447 [Lactarius hatsudake]|nr:hypothetical protein EDB86DRAFT_2826447 [Lactarius hatsudake]